MPTRNSLTPGIERRSRKAMHQYQREVVRRLLSTTCFGILLDPGLGKTICALTGIVILKATGKLKGPVVVVTTPRIAATVWAAEAGEWEHAAHLRIVSVIGTPAERKAKLATPADIYVCSIHSLASFISDWRALGRGRIGLLICDESSLIKSPESKRTRRMIALGRHAERRWIMTGTPRSQGAHELFSQVAFVDLGKRWGLSWYEWRQRFMRKAGFYNWVMRDGAEEAIARDLRDLVVSVKARDVLTELPERIDIPVHVPLPPEAMEAYAMMADRLVAVVDGEVISAENPAIQAGRLAQMAAGFSYDEDGGTRWLHTEKLDAVEELVGQQSGPVIVWVWHRAMLEALKQRFPKSEVLAEAKDVDDLVRRWNAGEIDVLIGHPASAGHGLNLAKGGSVAIWIELPRSAELFVQAVARLDRQGQTEPVRQFILMADNTIDALIFDVLRFRVDQQDTMREAWRLFVAQRSSPVDLRELRRRAAMAHPDRGGSEENFRRLWAEYEAALAAAEAA